MIKKLILKNKDIQRGINYIILSGLCFMIVNFLVKILGSTPSTTSILPTHSKYPPHELVLFRSVISFVISAIILKKRKIPILGTNKKWLLIRGFSGMIALTLFFYTIHHLPIAIASTIQYLAPIFTILLASFLLSERINIKQWICILIALSGVFLIGISNLDLNLNTIKETISWKWIMIGICSSVFSGLAYVSVLKLKATETPLNIVIYFPMLSIPIMTIWCIFDFVIPTTFEWLYLFLLGIFTQMAQVLMTKAFLLGNITIISPFQYLGSIYAIIVGYYFFSEKLPILVFFGIFLIVMGVIVNIFVKEMNVIKHSNGK